jgi:alpha-ribazole phosphatase
MRLYLVRHPKVRVAQGLCYGATDVACSPQELEAAAHDLRRVLPKGLRLISSPLQRCERLTQILCGLEPDLLAETDDKLAEMHFGAWEMRAWNAIPAAELKAWTDDFATYRCGGSGESAGQLVHRVAQRLWRSAQSGQDEVWITHAGVIRAVRWLGEQAFEMFTALGQPQGSQGEILAQLRAADWPRSELAFARPQVWEWPQAWPR